MSTTPRRKEDGASRCGRAPGKIAAGGSGSRALRGDRPMGRGQRLPWLVTARAAAGPAVFWAAVCAGLGIGQSAAAATARGEEVRVLKIVVQANQEDEDYHGAVAFRDYVEAATHGGLKVEIFPGGQLCGSNRECLEAVMLGVVEVFMATTGGSAVVFPEIQVLDIPYLLSDDAVAEQVLSGPFRDAVQKAVLERTGNLRLMTIGNTGGWRSIATKSAPVRSPADLLAVKLRTVSSDLQIEFVHSLGASPTPIAWPEVYTSLATGVVDGTKNSVTDIVGMNFHDYVKYITLDRHGYMAAFWWMSDDFFSSLPSDWQRAVEEGFQRLRAVTLAIPKQREAEALAAFVKKEGQVYKPSPVEKELFRAAALPVRSWYVSKYGNYWFDLLCGSLPECKAEN